MFWFPSPAVMLNGVGATSLQLPKVIASRWYSLIWDWRHLNPPARVGLPQASSPRYRVSSKPELNLFVRRDGQVLPFTATRTRQSRNPRIPWGRSSSFCPSAGSWMEKPGVPERRRPAERATAPAHRTPGSSPCTVPAPLSLGLFAGIAGLFDERKGLHPGEQEQQQRRRDRAGGRTGCSMRGRRYSFGGTATLWNSRLLHPGACRRTKRRAAPPGDARVTSAAASASRKTSASRPSRRTNKFYSWFRPATWPGRLGQADSDGRVQCLQSQMSEYQREVQLQ